MKSGNILFSKQDTESTKYERKDGWIVPTLRSPSLHVAFFWLVPVYLSYIHWCQLTLSGIDNDIPVTVQLPCSYPKLWLFRCDSRSGSPVPSVLCAIELFFSSPYCHPSHFILHLSWPSLFISISRCLSVSFVSVGLWVRFFCFFLKLVFISESTMCSL